MKIHKCWCEWTEKQLESIVILRSIFSLRAMSGPMFLLLHGSALMSWPVFLLKAIKVSMVCAAVWNHVNVSGSCCCRSPYWLRRPGLPLEVIGLSLCYPWGPHLGPAAAGVCVDIHGPYYHQSFFVCLWVFVAAWNSWCLWTTLLPGAKLILWSGLPLRVLSGYMVILQLGAVFVVCTITRNT